MSPNPRTDLPMITPTWSFLTPSDSGDETIALCVDDWSLTALVLQSAANILRAIDPSHGREYPVDRPEVGGLDNSPTPKILRNYVNWSDCGYINALLAQVKFVYGFVVSVANGRWSRGRNGPMSVLRDGDAAMCITDALIEFQRWKTVGIALEKRRYNAPTWGDATGWNQADWTDHNKGFLDVVYWRERGRE